LCCGNQRLVRGNLHLLSRAISQGVLHNSVLRWTHGDALPLASDGGYAALEAGRAASKTDNASSDKASVAPALLNMLLNPGLELREIPSVLGMALQRLHQPGLQRIGIVQPSDHEINAGHGPLLSCSLSKFFGNEYAHWQYHRSGQKESLHFPAPMYTAREEHTGSQTTGQVLAFLSSFQPPVPVYAPLKQGLSLYVRFSIQTSRSPLPWRIADALEIAQSQHRIMYVSEEPNTSAAQKGTFLSLHPLPQLGEDGREVLLSMHGTGRTYRSTDAPPELVARARYDRGAFGDLYDQYLPRVYGFCRKYSETREEAEDLTAETFERALVGISRYEDRNLPFSSWLLRIAHNVILNHARRAGRVTDLSDNPALISDDSYLEAWEEAHWLRMHVQQLPHDQQEVVRLRFYEDQRFQDIAARMDRSEGAVKQLLRRALQGLYLRIQQEGEIHE